MVEPIIRTFRSIIIRPLLSCLQTVSGESRLNKIYSESRTDVVVRPSSTYSSARYLGMACRRLNSTQRTSQREEVTQNGVTRHDHIQHKHSHDKHDSHDHGHDAEQIVQALQTVGEL